MTIFVVDSAHGHAESDIASLTADLAAKAPSASPVLTGDPKAPTPAPGDNDTSIATSAFVKAAVDALIAGAPGALDTLNEIAAQLATDESAVGALTTTVAAKAAKASNLSDLANAATARTNLGLGTAAEQALDTDTALAANSDTRIASQKATKGYVDTASGLLVPKSLVDAKGDLFVGTADNTVARKAAGSSGQSLVVDSSSSDGLRFTTLRVKPQAGQYLGPQGGGIQSVSKNSGFQEFTPLLIPVLQTFDRIGFYLYAVAGTTGTVRLGLYADVDGLPSGAPILDAGAVPITAGTGAKEITVSQQLSPGLVWASAQPESTGSNPALGCNVLTNTPTVAPMALLTAPAGGAMSGYYQAHTGAFAAPGALTAFTGIIAVYLRGA